MMTPVLGEFLRPAQAHITAAARFGGELPITAKRGVIAELARIVITIARYLDDLALPTDFSSASNTDHDVRAALDARLAARRAASSLRQAATAVQDAAADNTHPAVGHLSSANGYLAAGRDLLQTHFTTGPAGAPVGSTRWATVINSRPVTSALLAELAAYSRKLAAWTAQLSRAGSLHAGLPADASQGLLAACRWLRIATTSVQAAHSQQPPTEVAYRLLAAVPSNIPPARQPPTDAEQVLELCGRIATTGERLRHAVSASADHDRWSPAANSVSWRRDALASAITGHASELVLRALAERAQQLGLSPVVYAQLVDAADAVSQTWPAWRAIAHRWDTISTGIQRDRAITAVATELGDLVLRTGRLAHRNPHWTPASADSSPVREPADLAGTARDIRAVVAAVHQAADAVGCIAIRDKDAVCWAADDRRLYLPTRLLPENYDIPCRYAPVPPPQADELIGAYDTMVGVTRSATMALDHLALSVNSPSSVLALARSATELPEIVARPAEYSAGQEQAQPDLSPNAQRPQAGQLEHILRGLDITEPRMLLRAAAIDDAALDVLAHASASTRNRDSINDPARRRKRGPPDGAIRTAAKDLPLEPRRPASATRNASVSAEQAKKEARRSTQLGRGMTAV
jgi:hypothetical protein